jgi:hypothetical protein
MSVISATDAAFFYFYQGGVGFMKTRNIAIIVAVGCIALGTAYSLDAADRTAPEGTPGGPATVIKADPGTQVRAVGTIQYDNDVPFSRDGQGDGLVGNRFVPSMAPHSVATVSFRVGGNYGAAAGSIVMTVWDVNPPSANVLHRFNITNAPFLPYGATGTITDQVVVHALTAPIAAHSGSFIAGLRQSAYAACAGSTAINSTCDGVALTQGSTNPGSGFNAVRLPFTSGSFVPTLTAFAGTGTAIANTNAIFRVTGDNLPVELMTFGIE